MNLSDHFTKFQCKTLKEHFGITTVEQAQALSDDKLKTARGINVMFCQKLRQIETKCRDRQIDLNTIMEKVKLPANFQPGDSVGLQGLIDLLEEAKDGKVVAANFTDSKVKYTLSVPHYRNGVELGYVRLANIDSALLHLPFDNGFHYNSKRDIGIREDQNKPRPHMISASWAEGRVGELGNRIVSEVQLYLDGTTDRIHLIDRVKSIMSIGLGLSEKVS